MNGEVVPDLPTALGHTWDTITLEEFVCLGTQSSVRDLAVEMNEDKVVLNGVGDGWDANNARKSAEAWLRERGMKREIVNLIGRTGGK
jgi:hypothetical protein